ncbi:MAG: hypothetical protein J5I93_20205 [Pirellulaceae bacterium]|nr:hypothetical protein [Pirellulaceae bacterium]
MERTPWENRQEKNNGLRIRRLEAQIGTCFFDCRRRDWRQGADVTTAPQDGLIETNQHPGCKKIPELSASFGEKNPSRYDISDKLGGLGQGDMGERRA